MPSVTLAEWGRIRIQSSICLTFELQLCDNAVYALSLAIGVQLSLGKKYTGWIHLGKFTLSLSTPSSSLRTYLWSRLPFSHWHFSLFTSPTESHLRASAHPLAAFSVFEFMWQKYELYQVLKFSFDRSSHLERGWSHPYIFVPFLQISDIQGRDWIAGLQSRAHSCARHLWPYGGRGSYCPTMVFPIITTWMEGWVFPDKMRELSRNQGGGHKTRGPWHIAISHPSLNRGFFIQQSHLQKRASK